jgi:hypothetical protein
MGPFLSRREREFERDRPYEIPLPIKRRGIVGKRPLTALLATLCSGRLRVTGDLRWTTTGERAGS